MTSKLDLLKRYGSAAASDSGGAKKRKKVRKHASSDSQIRVVHDDDGYRPNVMKVNAAWEDAEEEDEMPVVVDETGKVVQSHSGSWSFNAEPPATAHARKDSPSTPRRPTVRKDSSSPPRRTRNDSPSPPRRPTSRKDSPSPPRRPTGLNDSPSPRRRPTSRKDSPSPPRRTRNVSPTADATGDGKVDDNRALQSPSPPKERAKTASGHTAGLMSISAFVAEDKALKAAAMEAAVSADGSGHTQEDTVYRDKRGRKLDMLNEMMRQQAIREGKAVAEAKEQYEWGKGTVQKEIDQRAQDELANIASEPFARSKDDARLDAMLRSKIHADDPMAQYMQEKEDTRAAAAPTADGKPRKPRYKGPAPQPNRFGIMPGYRWDGRDRGNGWEATVANAAAAKVRNKDAAYQWSTSDM